MREPRTRFTLLGVVASCAALVAVVHPALAPSQPTDARNARLSETPKVICITNWRPPEGAYRRKPRRCMFHERGEFPIAGANTATTGRLHWKRWGRRRARAKGKVFITTYGWAPARVKLWRQRKVCGRKVFTKVRIKYRARVDGRTYRDSFRISIDNCLD